VGKTASAKQAALAKARERRLALDAERDERDRLIEDAAAEVFVLLAQRAEAEKAVAVANVAIGRALRVVLDEGVGVDGVAQLVELEPAEIRRLTRPAAQDSPGDAPRASSSANGRDRLPTSVTSEPGLAPTG
jgi:hypothetical protein